VLACAANIRSTAGIDHGECALANELLTQSHHFAQPSDDGRPVRRFGTAFFDDLVRPHHPPQKVRRGIFTLLSEQYKEASRISTVRGWGGAQPYGNDRYRYSRHQASRITQLIPGAHLTMIHNAVTIQLGQITLYPIHWGETAAQCPTSVKIDLDKGVRVKFVTGALPRRRDPSLFDEVVPQDPEMVWVIFTGNHIEGGPLSSYVAKSKGYLPDGRLALIAIEPLLDSDTLNSPHDPTIYTPLPPPVQPKEPEIRLSLRS
jgi:hypothetical protein